MITFYFIMWILAIAATAIYFLLKFHYSKRKPEFKPQISLEYWNNPSILLLNMINDYRLFYGVNKLLPEALTHSLADLRCTTVINNFFIEGAELSHRGFPDVVSMALDEGINQVGENLAYGFNSNIVVFNNFRDSKSHNENMLNPNWKYIGIDIREDLTINKKFYVVIFSN